MMRLNQIVHSRLKCLNHSKSFIKADFVIEKLYLYLLLIFILAGFVKGVTGMGLPTVAMGLISLFMPLPVAAALLVIPSFVTNVLQLCTGPSVRQIIQRLWRMMLLLLAGTAAASSLLISINATWSAFGLGVALLIYAAFALVSPSFTVPESREKWLSPVIGGVTGVITGATGVFVMPAVPFLQSLRLSKDELVQALGLSFTVSTVALAAGLYLHDAFRVEQFSLSFLSLFPALAGMWLGQKVRARISARLFRKCFLLFLIVLALELISRPFI